MLVSSTHGSQYGVEINYTANNIDNTLSILQAAGYTHHLLYSMRQKDSNLVVTSPADILSHFAVRLASKSATT